MKNHLGYTLGNGMVSNSTMIGEIMESFSLESLEMSLCHLTTYAGQLFVSDSDCVYVQQLDPR